MATERKYAISTSTQTGYLATYPDLAAFGDAIGPNYPDGNGLSVQDHKVIAEIYPDANPHTEPFDMRGEWKNGNEGADNLLLITAAPGHKYDYKTDTGAKWVCDVVSYIHRDEDGDSVLHVEDLGLDQITASKLYKHFDKKSGTIIRVERCVSLLAAAGERRFYGIVESDPTYSIKNTLVINDMFGAAFHNCVAENCTCVLRAGEIVPIYISRAIDVHNVCLSSEDNITYGCFYLAVTFTGNCASSDNSANTKINIPTSAFKDYAAKDYHPADGGDLHGTGSPTTSILDLDGLPWADGDQNIGCFSTNGEGGTPVVPKPNPLFFGQDF